MFISDNDELLTLTGLQNLTSIGKNAPSPYHARVYISQNPKLCWSATVRDTAPPRPRVTRLPTCCTTLLSASLQSESESSRRRMPRESLPHVTTFDPPPAAAAAAAAAAPPPGSLWVKRPAPALRCRPVRRGLV